MSDHQLPAPSDTPAPSGRGGARPGAGAPSRPHASTTERFKRLFAIAANADFQDAFGNLSNMDVVQICVWRLLELGEWKEAGNLAKALLPYHHARIPAVTVVRHENAAADAAPPPPPAEAPAPAQHLPHPEAPPAPDPVPPPAAATAPDADPAPDAEPPVPAPPATDPAAPTPAPPDAPATAAAPDPTPPADGDEPDPLPRGEDPVSPDENPWLSVLRGGWPAVHRHIEGAEWGKIDRRRRLDRA